MADAVIPLFTKNVFQWDPMAAGLILLCVCVPGLAAPGVGWLADRHGAKLLSAFGFVGSVPPIALLRLVHENTTHDKILLGALLTLLGFTYTFASTPLMAEITYVIQAEEARQPGVFGATGVFGMGYGLFTFSFALGGTLGSLISGYLVAEVGWNTMSWALATWMGVGGIVVGLWVGG
jgi:MFS family permease